MKKDVVCLDPEDKIEDIKKIFDSFTGAPVVNKNKKLIGVVSKKDFQKNGVRPRY